MGFKVREVLEATGGVLVTGNAQEVVRGISIDSRTIKRGELFLAIRGECFDGHRFVRAALKKGARGAVVSCGLDGLKSLLTTWPQREGNRPVLIRVSNTIKALGEIAASRRSRFTGVTIAITGSSGKTTTKDMLAEILGASSPVLKNEGTKNNHIGVPLTLLRLRPAHRMAVIEMGMNHRGEIRRLARMVRPRVGIITGVGQAHLGFLGTKRAIARAKCELLEELGNGDLAVINADHPLLLKEAMRFGVRLVTFGIKTPAQFTASRINWGEKGVSFRVNGKYPVKMQLVGEHNVYNALAAWSAAASLGINRKQIQKSLKSFRPPPMRMELIRIDGVTIINDAYNSNPEAFHYALRTLSGLDAGRRKVLVAGDMLELGSRAETLHRRLGREAANYGVDLLVCAGEYSPVIKEGALRAGMEKDCAFSFRRRCQAERLILTAVRPGDIILIKGSRRMEMEKVAEVLASHFALTAKNQKRYRKE